MQISGVMRSGGGIRAGVVVCLALVGGIALLLAPGCTKKEAPVEATREPTVREVFQQGVDALRKNDVDPAIDAFTRITEQAYEGAPERPQAFFYLGLIAYRAGKMDLAIQNFQAALTLNPEISQARLSLGNAHFAAGRLDEAIATWEVLAKERPNLASVHNNLGIAYLDKGDTVKAIEHLERTVALSPDNYRAHKNLVLAYRRMGLTEEAEAAERKVAALRSRMMSGAKEAGSPGSPEEASEGPTAAPEAPAPAAPETP